MELTQIELHAVKAALDIKEREFVALQELEALELVTLGGGNGTVVW